MERHYKHFQKLSIISSNEKIFLMILQVAMLGWLEMKFQKESFYSKSFHAFGTSMLLQFVCTAPLFLAHNAFAYC